MTKEQAVKQVELAHDLFEQMKGFNAYEMRRIHNYMSDLINNAEKDHYMQQEQARRAEMYIGVGGPTPIDPRLGQ